MNANPLLPPPRPPVRRTCAERWLSPRRLVLLLGLACALLLLQKQDVLRKYAADHRLRIPTLLKALVISAPPIPQRECGSPAIEGYKVGYLMGGGGRGGGRRGLILLLHALLPALCLPVCASYGRSRPPKFEAIFYLR